MRKIKALDNKTVIPDGFSTMLGTNIIDGGVSKFRKLYDEVGGSLITLLDSYATGDFDHIASETSSKKFQDIGHILYKHATTARSARDFEKYRLAFASVLQGLQQSVIQYGLLTIGQHNLEQCQEKSSILDDMDKLKAYLESKKMQYGLFGEQTVTPIQAILKPQYARYKELYGLPDNMIFDPDKMAAILIELGLT